MNAADSKRYLQRMGEYWSAGARQTQDRFEAVHFSIADQQTYDSLIKEILYYVNLHAEDKILEVGCGNGLFLENLQRAGYKNLTGCDIAEGLIEQAKTATPDIPLFVTDAADLSIFDAESFDFLFAHGIFHYFPSDDYVIDVVREMMRVTKATGTIMILDVLGSYWQQWGEKTSLQVAFKNWVKQRVGQGYKVHRYQYTDPKLFFDALDERQAKIYPMVEVLNDKPLIFKQFRYNVLIEKMR